MRSHVSWLLAPLLLLALAAGSLGAEMPAGASALATLRLANGDYLSGELRDCDQADSLRMQGSAFAAPLDFPLGAVSAVSFLERRGPRPRPDGLYCLELEGGDVLSGALVGLSNQEARLDVPGPGLLRVHRSAIQRISHLRGQVDLVYSGPNGLSEWKESPAGAWEQDAGQLFTLRSGATLVGELSLPAKACLDFELSWTSEPDFTFALGTRTDSAEQVYNGPLGQRRVVRANAGSSPDDPPFRVEVWDRELLLLGETAEKADLATLQDIAPGAGRCHFRIYLDQEQNRAMAFGADGRLLADVALADASAPPAAQSHFNPDALARWLTAPRPSASHVGACLRLVNHRGNVRLEHLSITRWNGKPPRAAQGAKSELHSSNGSVVNGEIAGFDASTQEFLIAEGDRKSRVRADAIESIVLGRADLAPAERMKVRPTECGVRAIWQNGIRLSGNLQKVEKGRLWLSCPGIVDPLAVELSALRSLVVLENRKPLSEPGGRRGRLEGDGVMLDGWLVESSGAPRANCLAWRPCGSTTSSPLKQEFSGRIVYRDVPPPQLSPPPNQIMPVRRPVAIRNGVRVAVPAAGGFANPYSPSGFAPVPRRSPALYLRTGDTIPCEVKQIDERGVTFHSPLFDATLAPNDKVKAVELENGSRATKLDLSKRDRLLTLPRMQKEDPPSHLIRSTDGDYLRGRLVALDDWNLTVEVRLETRRIPRDHIASIIWLDKSGDKDKKDPAKETAGHSVPTVGGKTAANAKSLTANRVQSLRSDGVRLTFRPEKLIGTVLRGTSDVLGPCRVELSQVDQLLIGGAIDQAAEALPYQRWKLQSATEPKFAQASGGPGAGQGTESDMVGKLAPEFELDTLDGKRFRLSDQRNKVVVVDFWATWCGPCRQTLPQIVSTVAKYQDRNVVLLAVNLQESAEAINATLGRLELKMPVGLDRNGAVAEKYAAVAIPQTVIIDGNGTVARLFVGGGPRYGDQLSEAIEAVLKPGAERGKSP